MADQPSLGYGQRGEASIDAFNQWFRSRPEYYAKLAEFGQDPTNVHLNDSQKQEMVQLAQSLGAVVDEGHNGQEVDDSGNFRAKSHALRNTLIVAGIAAAALATMGAAGVFSGAGAGAAGATSSGTLASAGTGLGAAAADVGAGALAPALAGGAGLAGVEGGAFGLGSGALAGLGTGAMGAVPVGAGLAGAAGGVGSAAVDAMSAGGAWDAAGNFIGPSTVTAAGGGGIGSVLKGIASSSWFPVALGVGGNLAGAAIQANQSDKALEAQSQAAREALEFAKSQAAIERQNFAPYLAAGTGALSKLSYGLGIGDEADYNSNGMPATPPGGSPGSITPVGDPVVSPKSPAAQFIANTRTQPVWMVAPTGERSQVPANQVQHYLERGAQLVPGQGLDGGSVPRDGALSSIGRTVPPGAEPVGMAAGRM